MFITVKNQIVLWVSIIQVVAGLTGFTKARLPPAQQVKNLIQVIEPFGFPASNVPDSTAGEIDRLCRDLEEMNPTKEPAAKDCETAQGTWRVLYTDAPPPSNGRFGPFVGEAFQIVDVNTGVYENYLRLFDGACEVSLKADWKVRDANTWRVCFRSIQFSVQGIGPTIKFPEGTERTWCLTYVDDDTRVVRAGVDGGKSTSRDLGFVGNKAGEAKDAYLFLMKRESNDELASSRKSFRNAMRVLFLRPN